MGEVKFKGGRDGSTREAAGEAGEKMYVTSTPYIRENHAAVNRQSDNINTSVRVSRGERRQKMLQER